MATIDSTLDDIMKMDFASREMILEILQKRQIEARRNEIAKNAKKSVKDYLAGENTSMSAEELINKLNSI